MTGQDTEPESIYDWGGSTSLGKRSDAHFVSASSELPSALLKLRSSERIRILGSRYSWPDLIDGHESSILIYDPEPTVAVSPARDHVWVNAAVLLRQVVDVLHQAGLRMAASLPVILEQTVAGAIATGTHGQGLAYGTLGDAVVAMSYLDLDGRQRTVCGDDAQLGAFRHHLGCLGVITDVALEVTEDSIYTCEKHVMSPSELLAEFENMNRTFPFCKAWLFPGEGMAHVWLVRPANEDESSAVRANDGTAVSHGDVSTSLNEAVNARARDIGRDTKSSDRHKAQFRTVDRFKDFETVSGYLPALLSQGIAVPQINCEVGIPLAQSSAALAELLDWSESEGHPFHYPLIVRATGPSSAWLSAAYERETCHLGLAIYRAADGTVPVDTLNHLGSVQEILSRRDGLPHWGKYFDPTKFEFARIKNWDTFHALRQELDPSGKLLSPMVRSALEG